MFCLLWKDADFVPSSENNFKKIQPFSLLSSPPPSRSRPSLPSSPRLQSPYSLYYMIRAVVISTDELNFVLTDEVRQRNLFIRKFGLLSLRASAAHFLCRVQLSCHTKPQLLTCQGPSSLKAIVRQHFSRIWKKICCARHSISLLHFTPHFKTVSAFLKLSESSFIFESSFWSKCLITRIPL